MRRRTSLTCADGGRHALTCAKGEEEAAARLVAQQTRDALRHALVPLVQQLRPEVALDFLSDD